MKRREIILDAVGYKMRITEKLLDWGKKTRGGDWLHNAYIKFIVF